MTISAFLRSTSVGLLLLAALPLSVHAQPKNYLIKGQGPTVYYNADDGKRYVFPNASVFTSWYPAQTQIAQIDDATLASLPLGGNVTYRPGSTLIKITTDPKVYAVSRYGVLHWVTTEQIATSLYGADWNKKVVDVPDTFFANYVVGFPIDSADAYSASDALASATRPTDNIRAVGFVPPASAPVVITPVVNAPQMQILLSNSQAVLNQQVTVTAEVSSSSSTVSRIEIKDAGTKNVLMTCVNSNTCLYQFVVNKAPQNANFTMTVMDATGHAFDLPADSQATLAVKAISDQIRIGATPLTSTLGGRVNLSSDASDQGSITSHKLFAIIPGVALPVLWIDCGTQSICAGSWPLYRTTSFYSEVVSGGQTFDSAGTTVQVMGGDAPKPAISVTGFPAANQFKISIKPPVGETIGLTTLIEGKPEDNNILALCDNVCDVTVQVSQPTTITALTNVGGKNEQSNTLSVKPE